jgi:hypothetical protein
LSASGADVTADESQLTRFERQVLDLIVATTGDAAKILSEQVAVATVVQRSEPSGSGAYIWLEVPPYAPRLRASFSAHVQSVDGVIESEGLERLAAYFILHIESGLLQYLEVVAPDAPWPRHPRLRSHAVGRTQQFGEAPPG